MTVIFKILQLFLAALDVYQHASVDHLPKSIKSQHIARELHLMNCWCPGAISFFISGINLKRECYYHSVYISSSLSFSLPRMFNLFLFRCHSSVITSMKAPSFVKASTCSPQKVEFSSCEPPCHVVCPLLVNLL